MLKADPQGSWLSGIRKEYQSNVDLMFSTLQEYALTSTIKVEGAFYLLLDASQLIGTKIPVDLYAISTKMDNLQQKIGFEIKSDIDIVKYFIYVAGVATVPGSGLRANILHPK